jgi:hypothetical protein
VTKDLIEAGENAAKETKRQKEEHEEKALRALAEVVVVRHADGNTMLKTEAQNYLHDNMEITRDRARKLIEAKDGILWNIRPVGGKGGGKGLFPVEVDDSAAKKNHEGKTAADRAQSGPQECDSHKRSEDNPFSDTLFSRRREFTGPENAAGPAFSEQKKGQKEASSSTGKDADGFNWETGEQEHSPDHVEKKTDDGFEDVPR